MRRCTWPLAVVLALAVALAAAVLARPGSAQALSAGCQALNDPSLDGFSGGGVIGPFAFAAGETVTISAAPPIGGVTPTTIVLIDPDALVTLASAAFPGTMEYTFPADITLRLDWAIPVGNTLVTWTVSCRTAPQQPTSIDQCKNGGWKNLVDNHGKPFTSQNACTDFVENNDNQGNDDSH